MVDLELGGIFFVDRASPSTGVTEITLWLQNPCEYEFTPMSPQSPKELLENLRASLKHFDECPEMGDQSDVVEIKRRLLRRIADVERIVRMTAR